MEERATQVDSDAFEGHRGRARLSGMKENCDTKTWGPRPMAWDVPTKLPIWSLDGGTDGNLNRFPDALGMSFPVTGIPSKHALPCL